MFGRRYNLLMQHALYRAFPHREGGGVPRDIATGHYNREAVRAQLRRELRVIRKVDMFAQLAAHLERLKWAKAQGRRAPGFTVSRPAARAGRRPDHRPGRRPGRPALSFSARLQKEISAQNSQNPARATTERTQQPAPQARLPGWQILTTAKRGPRLDASSPSHCAPSA
jgi:hypothetical protein